MEDLDDLTTKLSTDHNKLATFTAIIGAISNLIVDKNIQVNFILARKSYLFFGFY